MNCKYRAARPNSNRNSIKRNLCNNQYIKIFIFILISNVFNSSSFYATHKTIRAWKNLPDSWKRGENYPLTSSDFNENQTIRFSTLENSTVKVPSSYLQKWKSLYVLPEERSRICVYLFLFFCPKGDCIEPLFLKD